MKEKTEKPAGQMTLTGMQVSTEVSRPAVRKRPPTKKQQREKVWNETLPAFVTLGHRRRSS